MKNFGTKKNDIEKAISFMEKLGITFNTHPRHNFTIMVDDTTDHGFVSPLFVKMSSDSLLDVSSRIRSLGFCGKRVVKALITAIASLEDEEINDLMNNFYIKSYSPKQIVDHFVDTFIAYCIKANVRVSKNTIEHKFMRNVWFSFGRTLGLAYTFIEVLKQEISYFRDCRNVEEVLGIAPVIEIQNPKVSKCSTCKHCAIDKHSGLKICKECYVDIPSTYTAKEIAEKYPSVISDQGHLCSKYIIHNIGTCGFYKSRIGAAAIHNKNIVNDKSYSIR